jgi:2,3-bisphosphoglycerate-dependent phosphoglycerate mutase
MYDLDTDLRPTTPGGRYLDPDAAADAIKAVASQGH